MLKRQNRFAPRPKRRTPKKSPPEKTYLETQYIAQLVKNKTSLCIKLYTNEEVRGYIQYYDKDFIRVTSPTGERLFIFKRDIKYLYEEPVRRRTTHDRSTRL